MTFSQLLSILISRWKIILGMVAFAVLVALALNVLLPQKYRASASVVLDVRNPDPVQEGGLGAAVPSYMATQIDILSSEQVARKVVDMLKLEQTPLKAQWLKATAGQGDFRSWAAQLLQRYLDVKPSRESNVIEVGYEAEDPGFAAVIANTFVKAYSEVNLSLRTDPARSTSAFFDAQARDAKTQLSEAQDKLSSFQREKGLIGAAGQYDDEMTKLNELAATLVGLRSQSADALTRSARVGSGGGAQLAEVMNNPVVAGLRSDLAQAETRLKQLKAKYGEAYPDVQQTQASIAELNAKIIQESARVMGSVTAGSSLARSREAEVQASYEAQRRKVLALKEDRDTAAILQSQVDTAQRAYDMILARIAQTELEGRLTMTNVSVLTPAVPPSFPSFPRPILNLAVAFVLGGIIGVILAVVLELRDRRVRTAEDVVDGMGFPLLGEMPSGAKVRPGIFLRGSGTVSAEQKPRRFLALSSSKSR